MFNKDLFSQILIKIYKSYNNQRDFAEATDVNRAYLSQYMNKKLENPPTPKILAKIANASKGITNYEELMAVCGHYEGTIENTVYEIYTRLKELSKRIYKKQNKDLYETESAIEHFQEYSADLSETLEKKELSHIFLTRYYRKEFFIEDYNFICTFLFLYESFLQCLVNENYIVLNNYEFTDWFDFELLYKKITNLEDVELFSYNSKISNINKDSLKDLCNYIKSFTTALNLSYLSDFDSNSLIELFKQKVKTSSNKNKLSEDIDIQKNNKPFNIPVLDKITAEQPILKEEYIDRYLQTDPDLYHLTDSDDYFYLKVSDNSMNKIIAKDTYVLFKIQNSASSNDIVLVSFDNTEPVIRKCIKLDKDIAILQALSTDKDSLIVITADQTKYTYKILGVMVGQINVLN